MQQNRWPHCPEGPPDWPASSDIFPRTSFCAFVSFLADSDRICINGMLKRPLRNSECGSDDGPFKNTKLLMSPLFSSMIENQIHVSLYSGISHPPLRQDLVTAGLVRKDDCGDSKSPRVTQTWAPMPKSLIYWWVTLTKPLN